MIKTERIRFTNEEKEKMMAKTKGKCAHCGKKLTLDTMTIEHLYPLNKGGDNSEYNTIALCEKCNNEKSNWVYDMSYYNYIVNKNDVYKYTYKLMSYIYNGNNDTNIFGKCNRIVYYLPSNYCDMLNSKKLKKNADKITRAIAKKIEIKQLYRGDLDNDALELIRHEYVKYDENNKPTDKCIGLVNEMALLEIFRISTFYGLYFNDKIVGITAFTNIEKLDVVEQSFKEAIYGRGYNKAYVITIMAFNEKYEDLINSIASMVVEYVGITNNAILYTSSDLGKYYSLKMRGVPVSSFQIIKNNDFIKEEDGSNPLHVEYIALDDYFDKHEEWVKYFRKSFNKNKELYESHLNKEET